MKNYKETINLVANIITISGFVSVIFFKYGPLSQLFYFSLYHHLVFAEILIQSMPMIFLLLLSLYFILSWSFSMTMMTLYRREGGILPQFRMIYIYFTVWVLSMISRFIFLNKDHPAGWELFKSESINTGFFVAATIIGVGIFILNIRNVLSEYNRNDLFSRTYPVMIISLIVQLLYELFARNIFMI